MRTPTDAFENELLAAIYEVLRNQQERLNELTVSHWALLFAIAERDEGLYEAFETQKEKLESGEMGRTMAANLSKMDVLLAAMKTGGKAS